MKEFKNRKAEINEMEKLTSKYHWWRLRLFSQGGVWDCNESGQLLCAVVLEKAASLNEHLP